jgi:hypothetical protein
LPLSWKFLMERSQLNHHSLRFLDDSAFLYQHCRRASRVR